MKYTRGKGRAPKEHKAVDVDQDLKEALRIRSNERKAAGIKPNTMTAMNEYALRKTWNLSKLEARVRAERQGGDGRVN